MIHTVTGQEPAPTPIEPLTGRAIRPCHWYPPYGAVILAIAIRADIDPAVVTNQLIWFVAAPLSSLSSTSLTTYWMFAVGVNSVRFVALIMPTKKGLV